MRKILLTLAFALFPALALAQPTWQVPNHSLAIGKGPGVIGFAGVGPCAADYPILGAGVTADPVCGTGPAILSAGTSTIGHLAIWNNNLGTRLTQDINATLAATLTISPPSGTVRALNTAQTMTGSLASFAANKITINDFANGDPSLAGTASFGMIIEHNFGYDGVNRFQGFRVGLAVQANQVAANANSNLNQYVAILPLATAAANDGGTGLTAALARGAIFGANPYARLTNGATNFIEAIATEFDVEIQAGASAYMKAGIAITNPGADAVKGSVIDTMIALYGASATKFDYGILLGKLDPLNAVFLHPIATTGTIMATKGSASVANGIDFSSYTFTTSAFKSPSFSVNGSGAITTGAAATATGTVNFVGSTSGTAILKAQNAAGTPTLTLPTTTGTLPSNPVVPITINAVTGDIGCATCLTTGSYAIPANKVGISASAAGAASTGLRSDVTLSIDTAISPTGNPSGGFGGAWTSLHEFRKDTVTSPSGGEAPGVGSPNARVWLNNTTAAVAGTQQRSPTLQWTGNGWSLAGSASRQLDWEVQLLPVQVAASEPYAQLNFNQQTNLGGWTTYLSLSGFLSGTGVTAQLFAPFTATQVIAAVNASTTGNGYSSLQPGDGTHTGYIQFNNAATTRVGYMGFDTGAGTISIHNNATTAIFTVDTTNNRVGVNKATPGAFDLDVNGAINSGVASAYYILGTRALGMSATGRTVVVGGTSASLTPDYNTAVGGSALSNPIASGSQNTAIGFGTMQSLTIGASNTAVGVNGLANITTASNNVAIGDSTLVNVTTSSFNTAVGQSALQTLSAGNAGFNVAVGYGALATATTGSSNTAVGAQAMQSTTTGATSIAIGYQAMVSGVFTGSAVIAIGLQAGKVMTSASNNIFVGNTSGVSATTATSNVAMGSASLQALTTGANNTAIGQSAGVAIISSGQNVFIGDYAGVTSTAGDGNTIVGGSASGSYGPTTGAGNIIIGYNETGSYGPTTGSNNVLIGRNLDMPTRTASSFLSIMNAIYGSMTTLNSGTTVSVGKIGIFNNNPGYEFDVTGKIKASSTVLTPIIGPLADSTTALQFTRADLSTVAMVLNTSTGASNWGILTVPQIIASLEPTVTISAPTRGYVALIGGTTTTLGYIQWNKHDGTRLAYMGADTDTAGTVTLFRSSDNSAFLVNDITNKRLGINKTPGAFDLDVNGDTNKSGQLYMPNITQTSAAQTGTVCWTSSSSPAGKFTVDTTVGCLTSIGAAKTITSRLDPRSALEHVLALDPVAFRYKSGFGDEGRYEQFGLIAEQVASVDERMVGRDVTGALRGVRYMELTSVLAGAVQQLKADNDNLRLQVDRLERRIGAAR